MNVLFDFGGGKAKPYAVSRVPCVGEHVVVDYTEDGEASFRVVDVCHVLDAGILDGRFETALQAIVRLK